ncbi:conserved membrane hypothetical protein [Hyella patelloides LEGE 07179]|uniref:Bacterial cell division membrane protein n=1 Tax=Hyella patelloides LEGE 07179 TaxID=945734 RepID=A0A563VR35_9CYAN|nr:hormogonium polysaccharide biosynthesis protein HpsL [Hyella patelloides]VEP13926.1 conserved membrane hypothetical protein [Hyella patelloides LEGE 07179]
MVIGKRKPKKKAAKTKQQPTTVSIKERLLKKRQAREARQKVIALSIVSLIVGLALALPLGLIINFKIASAVIVLIPSFVLSYSYPRKALWFFLIYMPLSGTITYWLGGGNPLFQLSKDIFYVPALLALIQDCRQKRKPLFVNKKLILTLSILVVCTLMTLFLVNGSQQFILPSCDSLTPANMFLTAPDGSYLLDPETQLVIRTPCKDGLPIVQGILGLKVFLGYIPLIFVGYYLVENKKQLIFLGRLLLVLAIVCCGLALIQYGMLTTGICAGTRGAAGGELFRASLEAKCFVGGSLLYSPSQGQIRLPGTFVSPWHWAWFLIANSFITFTVAFTDTSLLWRTAGLGGLALVFINSVVSGQRLALALVPVCIVISLILTGQIANLKRFIPFGIGLALILSVVAASNPQFVQQRIDSFVARWNTAPPHLFILEQFNYADEQQRGILGRGLGKATNSARAFGSTALIETYHPKLLYEVGYPGLIAFMIFITNLVIVTLNSYREVKDKTINSFGSSFWVFILIISYFPYWYPLDTDPVSVYYWLFAGVLLKLPVIEKQEKQNIRLETPEETDKEEVPTKFLGRNSKRVNSRTIS